MITKSCDVGSIKLPWLYQIYFRIALHGQWAYTVHSTHSWKHQNVVEQKPFVEMQEGHPKSLEMQYNIWRDS